MTIEQLVGICLSLLAVVTWRAVELHFRNKREARAHEALVIEAAGPAAKIIAMAERFTVFETALTANLNAIRAIVAETESERRKAVNSNTANNIRPAPRRPMPQP